MNHTPPIGWLIVVKAGNLDTCPLFFEANEALSLHPTGSFEKVDCHLQTAVHQQARIQFHITRRSATTGHSLPPLVVERIRQTQSAPFSANLIAPTPYESRA
jgi:hypothetical protein